MEKLKNKHDHKLTNILKTLIFSIVMLAPFFSVLIKCLYVTCNKNAKDSYYGETINEKIVHNTDYLNLTENVNYYLYLHNIDLTDATSGQSPYSVYFINGKFNTIDIDEHYNRFRLYGTTNNSSILIYSDDSVNYPRLEYVLSSNPIFYFTYVNNSGTDTNNFWSQFTFQYYTYNKDSYLDNAFYYAVEDLKNEQLFNWTEDTAIYSAINTMCTGLDIQGGVLPLLLTYWALMTAIYIVFDIIIMVFVKLTHFME